MNGWGRCADCRYDKTGICDGQVCAPCLERRARPAAQDSCRSCGGALAAGMTCLCTTTRSFRPLTVTRAMAELDRRRPLSWQEAFAQLRRRYAPPGR